MKTILLIVLNIFIVLLVGCANQSISIQQQSITDKSITIVPEGKIIYDSSSNRGGAGFGALGVLVESAVTKDSINITNEILQKDVTEDLIMTTGANQLEKSLLELGLQNKIQLVERQFTDKSLVELNNDVTKSYITKNSLLNSNLVLELIIPRVGVAKEFTGWYATGFVYLKLVDRSTGEVLAKSGAYGVGATSGELIKSHEDSPTYKDDVITAFDTLIKKLTDRATKKLFTP